MTDPGLPYDTLTRVHHSASVHSALLLHNTIPPVCDELHAACMTSWTKYLPVEGISSRFSCSHPATDDYQPSKRSGGKWKRALMPLAVKRSSSGVE